MGGHDYTPKVTRPAPDDFQKKSLDLTIDSLKLYVTLSTFAFGGLLVILNAQKQPVETWTCYISLACFVLCCIVSVFTINGFINKVYEGEMNPMENSMRAQNGFAIGLFALGMIFGTIFISVQNSKKDNGPTSVIKVNNGVLEIKGNISTEYEIQTDSVNRTKTIVIKLN